MSIRCSSVTERRAKLRPLSSATAEGIDPESLRIPRNTKRCQTNTLACEFSGFFWPRPAVAFYRSLVSNVHACVCWVFSFHTQTVSWAVSQHLVTPILHLAL